MCGVNKRGNPVDLPAFKNKDRITRSFSWSRTGMRGDLKVLSLSVRQGAGGGAPPLQQPGTDRNPPAMADGGNGFTVWK